MWILRQGMIAGRGALDAGAAAAYQGPGDIVGSATAWGSSARAYSAAYAASLGAMLDLVDQANANPITINCLSNGLIDVAAITAWVSANSVSTIKVKQVYDQTGNARHWSQATLATMPTLTLSALNGLPGLTFVNASSHQINSTSYSTSTASSSYTTVAKRTGTTGIISAALGSNSAGTNFVLGFDSTVNNARFGMGGGSDGIRAATDNSFHSIQGINGGIGIVVDGTVTAATPNANFTVGCRIGRSGAGTTMDGIVMEVGIWNSVNFNSTQYGDMNTNARHATNGYGSF